MTFNSVYEITNNLSTVARQRFVSWLSGNLASTSISSGTNTGVLNEWSVTNNSGTNSYESSDAVNGGFKITTGAVDGNVLTLNNGNNASHMWTDNENCTWIAVAKLYQITNQKTFVGLRSTTSGVYFNNANGFVHENSASSYFSFTTAAGNTAEATNTDITADTNWHTFKGTQSDTAMNGYIDGVLKATNTTRFPNGKQEFTMSLKNADATARSMGLRYVEVYNT